eukprot:CAMPEP_0203814586 /NCGR_PEP_ID=MMETSP0115-20131106/5372_1 /ASSEMBLY_ACC=CAM_ASM_000227 /TAXON_ID=33651 /ORGANISM="Bicosoecid sp, Strain ms1" /LENGTH=621 /DNA_ID=CAMNT_0050723467 /DNA_START=34 /DNA_END=1896 /DNA_ORIENTATION=+
MADDEDMYVCPLTHEVMRDPVIDPEGNSYERSAIEDWLSRNPTSPITRAPLRRGQLAPNRALKALIDARIASGDLSAPDAASASSAAAAAAGPLAPPSPAARRRAPPFLPDAAGADGGAAGGAGGDGFGGGGGGSLAAVGLSVQAQRRGGDVVLVATATPADATTRVPADLCCVVDVSGSMCSAATMKSGEVDAEEHGLSLLDIVKHAVSTVVHSLKDGDRLSIVAYSDRATVIMPLTAMSSTGKREADRRMKLLKPGGRTNLWDGLETGMEMLRRDARPGRTQAVLLLTDGCPNIEPPRGHMPMLRRYLAAHREEVSPTIFTFGFGYQLDSALLDDIATEGAGAYSFIPDSSFVGTVFVHAVSNVLTTAARDVAMQVDVVDGGASLAPERLSGGLPHDVSAAGALNVRLGNLQLGQRRDVVVHLKVREGVDVSTAAKVTLRHTPAGASAAVSVTLDVADVVDGAAAAELEAQAARALAVDAMVRAVETASATTTNKGASVVSEAVRAVKVSSPAACALRSGRWAPLDEASRLRPGEAAPAMRVAALLDDLEGQVTEALSRDDWYERWGRHYVPSLRRAHQLQVANNFKDPGVQFYGGTLFRKERDEADATFCRLPPPSPS